MTGLVTFTDYSESLPWLQITVNVKPMRLGMDLKVRSRTSRCHWLQWMLRCPPLFRCSILADRYSHWGSLYWLQWTLMSLLPRSRYWIQWMFWLRIEDVRRTTLRWFADYSECCLSFQHGFSFLTPDSWLLTPDSWLLRWLQWTFWLAPLLYYRLWWVHLRWNHWL